MDKNQRKHDPNSPAAIDEAYRMIAGASPDYIVTTDTNGSITFINISPTQTRKVIGTKIIDHVQEKYHDSVNTTINQVLKTGEPGDYLCEGKAPNGKTAKYLTQVSPIKEGDRIIGVTLISTDLTRLSSSIAHTRDNDTQLALRRVIDLVPNMIFTKDADDRFIWVNQAVADAYNTSVANVIGRRHAELHPNRDELSRMQSDDRQVITTAKTRFIREQTFTDRKGRKRILQTTKIPFQPDLDAPRAVLVVSTDITDRKRAEQELTRTNAALRRAHTELENRVIARTKDVVKSGEALRRHKNILESVLDSMSDGVVTANRHGEVIVFNQSVREILGVDLAGAQVKDLALRAGLYHEDGRTPLKPEELAISRAMKGQTVENMSVFARKNEGSEGIWLNVSARPISSTDEENQGAVVIVRDVTQFKVAERKVMEYQEELRSLASQIAQAEQDERRRIASGLHDHIVQMLALAKMQVSAMIANTDEPKTCAQAKEVVQTISEVIEQTRTLAFDLSPPSLFEQGLTATVQELIDQMQDRCGLAIEFQDDGEVRDLPDDLRTLLYQAIRELLINVTKHAKAASISISVGREGDHLRISIRDDGVGFDLAERRNSGGAKGGYGLLNIRERLRQFGGKLEVVRDEERGTVASVTLQYPPSRGT